MIGRIKRKGKKESAPRTTAPAPLTRQQPLPVTATISYGGWMPRTSMHMDELYLFLTQQSTQLPLSTHKLLALHQELDLQYVSKEAGYLEYIRVTTNSDIEFRFYEDGMYVLEIAGNNPDAATRKLKSYHDSALLPALEYLYSIGTPLPAIGKAGDHNHPVMVALPWPHPRHFDIGTDYGEIQYQIEAKGVCLYKTSSHIFVVAAKNNLDYLRDLVEMQLFFREYQSRLEYYLQLQRKVWSDVNHIHQRKHIKPADLPKLHRLLLRQQQTTTLTQGRLEQMDAYVQTRAAIAEQLDLSEQLLMLFHYRFEALEDSYHYLRRNWDMTQQYVDQASELLATIQDHATHQLIASQRFMIVLLTVSSVAAWLSASNVFTLEQPRIMAFIIVIALAIIIAWISGLKINYSEYRIKLATKKARPQK